MHPAPNACWQLDATEYVLTGGRKCVILQLIDDHSRDAVASDVARGETAPAPKVDGRRGLEQGLVITAGEKITVADLEGEILIEHTRPAAGGDTRRQQQAPRQTPQKPGNVTEVLTHHRVGRLLTRSR